MGTGRAGGAEYDSALGSVLFGRLQQAVASADLARIEDLLCPILPASRDSTRHHRGITRHPTEQWITQMARNAVDEIDGVLRPVRFALHDRDSKFCASFRAMLRSGGVQPLLLPAQSPNLNAFAERGALH